MKILETLVNWWQKIIEFGQDLLVPENIKTQKLLNIPVGMMRNILPQSSTRVKDVFVLFDYQNKIVQFIIKSIKYKNNANLRKRVAQYLYEEMIDISSEITLFEGTQPILVPMPMSKIEKRKRGFNQCEEIAKEIKKLSGENLEVFCDILKKIRETERQTNLSRIDRLKNVKNSMIVSDNNFGKIKNRTVVVLDDVYTTGASFSEAKRALLSAGARRIMGLFIAH